MGTMPRRRMLLTPTVAGRAHIKTGSLAQTSEPLPGITRDGQWQSWGSSSHSSITALPVAGRDKERMCDVRCWVCISPVFVAGFAGFLDRGLPMHGSSTEDGYQPARGTSHRRFSD